MIALGVLIAATGAVRQKSIINCLHEKFVGKALLCECNERAFITGLHIAMAQK